MKRPEDLVDNPTITTTGHSIGRTNVMLADGTEKTIRSIIKSRDIGIKVLGCSKDGDIVPVKITAFSANGSEQSDGWMRIVARGSNKVTFCTKDQPWWTDNRGWVKASNLRINDEIMSVRSGLTITPIAGAGITWKIAWGC